MWTVDPYNIYGTHIYICGCLNKSTGILFYLREHWSWPANIRYDYTVWCTCMYLSKRCGRLFSATHPDHMNTTLHSTLLHTAHNTAHHSTLHTTCHTTHPHHTTLHITDHTTLHTTHNTSCQSTLHTACHTTHHTSLHNYAALDSTLHIHTTHQYHSALEHYRPHYTPHYSQQ